MLKMIEHVSYSTRYCKISLYIHISGEVAFQTSGSFVDSKGLLPQTKNLSPKVENFQYDLLPHLFRRNSCYLICFYLGVKLTLKLMSF